MSPAEGPGGLLAEQIAESSSTIRRRLGDGSLHRLVKVPHEPRDLERRLAALGRRITVT